MHVILPTTILVYKFSNSVNNHYRKGIQDFKKKEKKKQGPPVAPQVLVESETPHSHAATRGTRRVQTLNEEEI